MSTKRTVKNKSGQEDNESQVTSVAREYAGFIRDILKEGRAKGKVVFKQQYDSGTIVKVILGCSRSGSGRLFPAVVIRLSSVDGEAVFDFVIPLRQVRVLDVIRQLPDDIVELLTEVSNVLASRRERIEEVEE